MDILKQVRDLLMRIWEESREIELERIRSIKALYEDIVQHNNTIYGLNQGFMKVMQQMNQINQLQIVNELYSFKGLISESELKAMI